MPDSRAVVVRGVTRRFGTCWVLRGVEARFECGSVTVVYGANGAGKSTLLSVVGGLLRPDAGSVTWEPDGQFVDQRREAVGWVGHESLAYRDLTVRENIELVARAHGIERSVAAVCLARVGAADLAERRVGSLSRGQKQRVALARGIVHAPLLLLLDEPFTGLDTRGSTMLESVMQSECDRGAAVVVVSHDPLLAARVGARSLWIERGKAVLTPQQGC